MIITPLFASILCLATVPNRPQPWDDDPWFPKEASQASDSASSPEWEGSLTLGSSLSMGNTEVTTVSAGVAATRTEGPGKWIFGLTSVYVKDQDAVTQRRNEGDVKYDHELTETVYVYGSLGAMTDAQAALDLRLDVSVGGGYKVWTEGPWTLDTELGLAHLGEEFDSGASNNYLALRGAYGLKWHSEGDALLIEQAGSLNPSLESGGDGYYRLDTSLKMNVSSNLFTKLQWVYDLTANPAAGKGKDDHLFLVTVGWSF
jgi:putative salt-induced outer membrane protein YdiY